MNPVKNKLYAAAEKAVTQSLRIKAGEQFLLVTDKAKMDIAEAFAFWAKKCGAETTTYLMTETLRPISEPTKLFRMHQEAISLMWLRYSRSYATRDLTLS